MANPKPILAVLPTWEGQGYCGTDTATNSDMESDEYSAQELSNDLFGSHKVGAEKEANLDTLLQAFHIRYISKKAKALSCCPQAQWQWLWDSMMVLLMSAGVQ